MKITIDGQTFDSKFEAEEYQKLLLLEAAGEIFDLQAQVPFSLERGEIAVRELRGAKVRVYTADATYYETEARDKLIVVEFKGYMRADASLRISVFKAFYPEHELRIIKQNKRRSGRFRKRKKRKRR